MLNILVPTIAIVAIAMFLLSVGVIIKGRFVNSHVSANKALRSKGIHCAQQQDKEARSVKKNAVKERGDSK